VCRTKTPARTYELYLRWDADGGHGTLRATTTDGQIQDELVQAIRDQDAIIVDHPGSTDLVSHLATVRRKAIQLGDWNAPWAECE